MSALETLLEVQSHDLASDQIRHRIEALPERAELREQRRIAGELDERLAALEERRSAVAREERRFADEAARIEERAKHEEAKLYSGEISSPRELQALQADVDSLRRHQRGVEDQQLEVMEARETIDGEVAEVEAQRATVGAEIERVEGILAEHEAEASGELAREAAARAELVTGLPDALVEEYEATRARSSSGAGAARLVGDTCQACHLSLPSTEVVRIRKLPPDELAFCENCGCILVPS